MLRSDQKSDQSATDQSQEVDYCDRSLISYQAGSVSFLSSPQRVRASNRMVARPLSIPSSAQDIRHLHIASPMVVLPRSLCPQPVDHQFGVGLKKSFGDQIHNWRLKWVGINKAQMPTMESANGPKNSDIPNPERINPKMPTEHTEPELGHRLARIVARSTAESG